MGRTKGGLAHFAKSIPKPLGAFVPYVKHHADCTTVNEFWEFLKNVANKSAGVDVDLGRFLNSKENAGFYGRHRRRFINWLEFSDPNLKSVTSELNMSLIKVCEILFGMRNKKFYKVYDTVVWNMIKEMASEFVKYSQKNK